LLPGATRVRARGVQVHGAAVRRAVAGQRTAVNLGGVDAASIERGMVLAPVGRLRPTQVIDVHLDVLRSATRALRSRTRVRVHLGAAEVLGRLRVLDAGAIEPGASGLAQLRLESPVVALPDERFIIRSYSPSLTIAGGRILDPLANRHRGKDLAHVRELLRTLMEADHAARFAIYVGTAGDQGQRLADIAARTGWNDVVLSGAAMQAEERGAVVDAEGVFIAAENFERLCRTTLEAVAAHHQREPLTRGMVRETLRERHFAHAAPEIFRAAIRRLEQEGKLVAERELVRARQHSLELSPGDAQLRDRLAQVYQKAALEAPTIDEAMEQASVSSGDRTHGRKILQVLIDGGVLVRVQGDLFFHRESLDRLRAQLHAYAASHEPDRTIDVSAFKDLARVSRKYAIPLLEYFDRERVTMRQGDRRVILRGMKAEG